MGVKTNLKMATRVMSEKTFKVMARLLSTSAMRSSGQGVGRITAPHHDSGWKKWRTAFFIVGIPCLVVGHLNAFVLADPEDHKRPEFVPYEYMRTRSKRFPWGDGNHSLFHNPQKNALPDGYEEEESHH